MYIQWIGSIYNLEKKTSKMNNVMIRLIPGLVLIIGIFFVICFIILSLAKFMSPELLGPSLDRSSHPNSAVAQYDVTRLESCSHDITYEYIWIIFFLPLLCCVMVTNYWVNAVCQFAAASLFSTSAQCCFALCSLASAAVSLSAMVSLLQATSEI